MAYVIHNNDCLKQMRQMEPDSVDAIVTDPPYGIAFMGADWDSYGSSTGGESVEERLRKGREYDGGNPAVPKFGNSHGKRVTLDEMRSFQERMTPIMAEALRVAKPGAHMLCFGGTRTFHRMACAIEEAGWCIKDCIMWVYGSGMPKGQRVERLMERDYPELADEWVGWSTQIKPAWESIIVAYKPFKGTVAKNVAEYGTGAMNIDACRVPTESHGDDVAVGSAKGRYPANLVHDGSDEVRACFPDSDGQQADVRAGIERGQGVCYGKYGPTNEYAKRTESDSSAARFFYCAKASKKDRGEGNDHISVKPNALMRWCVRLVCRPGGAILDPFMGSGSTGVACMQEGMDFIGCELDPHYCEIAERRISEAERDAESERECAQATLF